MAGWDEDITTVRNFADLPQAAQNYIIRIEELCGVKVWMIGIGPGRDQNIIK